MILESNQSITARGIFKFIIPSLLGIFLFMIPIPFNGQITIPVAIFAKVITTNLELYLPTIAAIIICSSVLFTIYVKIAKPKFLEKNKFLKGLFNVKPIWFWIRIIGMTLVVLTLFELGPEWIFSENTGGLLLNSLLPVLFAVFLFAGLLLPLLLNFGLLEFVGTLLTKIMRPIFNLPGRSSIDCITSWLGDGTIGVLLTSKQYEEGYYTKREAAVIGTTFSAVSITFSLVVLQTVRLEEYFLPYYLTICLAGVVAAIILPRIPPLSRKEDTYCTPPKDKGEVIPNGYSKSQWGLRLAVQKAKSNNIKDIFKEGTQNVLEMWLGVMPVVMAIGTIAVIIAEYTSVFKFLGLPFYPILKLFQVPEALSASQTFVVGFADMFLPSVIAAATIESEMTKFIVAAVSVTQLIYMSEVGGLLIGSKIPVNMKDLLILFIERTLVTLPVIVIVAHILF